MTFLILALIIVLLLLSRNYILRLEPAGIFAVMWIIFTVAVLALQEFIALRFSGVLFIVVSVISYIVGTIFCDFCIHPTPSGTKLEFQRERALPLVFILFIGAMVNPLYSIILHGFSLQALLSMQDLLNMNKGISEDRYFQGDVSNAINQFFLIFCYAAPLLGGFCYKWVGKWTRVVCLLTLIPGMFIALTQSMKMAMITGFILWFSGYLVSCFSYGVAIRFKPLTLFYSILGFMGFFGILFFSMVFRTGEVSEKTILDISEKFVTYALGHFHCFDMWFTTHEPASYAWGGKTFLGISSALGIEERIQGLYQEYYQVGQNGYSGISNIFTIFRPLIEDFGEAGALLAMFVVGFLSKLSLKNLVAGNLTYLNQTILTAVYAYLLWSFVASFFTYMSYVAMFVLAYILFHFLQTKTETC